MKNNKETRNCIVEKRRKMRVINTSPHHHQVKPQIDFNTFNPLCKVQQAVDGSLYVKMMVQQTPHMQHGVHQHQQHLQHYATMNEPQNDHPTLKRYIDGWLDFKEKRKMSSKVCD